MLIFIKSKVGGIKVSSDFLYVARFTPCIGVSSIGREANEVVWDRGVLGGGVVGNCNICNSFIS